MLQNLFKSWSLICFGIQQHINNVLDLCFKKKKQMIINLDQIFTGNALKITALSLRTLRVAISKSRKEKNSKPEESYPRLSQWPDLILIV